MPCTRFLNRGPYRCTHPLTTSLPCLPGLDTWKNKPQAESVMGASDNDGTFGVYGPRRITYEMNDVWVLICHYAPCGSG